ncbi:CDP-glycerol glycerophosphotransferase family protein [Cryobacterium sp. PH31-O1]|uniref:CDP-glycerol glycerophosphotransferase family protein n=1 Tax=Cryobacterium sp. PH31-O1 TaxID=3046306 RepID=UPI0024B92843|nr:CDP-glycerol glycerophosphotransferase family protein [Cryobacterium sp. PH31-O1]MDJ0337507.1 CDP-glycerol glycerophosphotransferase family protein [Cryobacterium sp. PH31-O1]
MVIRKDIRRGVKLVRDVVASRKAQHRLRGPLKLRELRADNHFKIAVYFADGPVNMYQMRQWYQPLATLAKTWPVLVLSRTGGGTLKLMDESPIPVAYARTVPQLEQIVAEQDIRIVFYVNQNPRNFQMMRYGRCWHVFINHGESDKMYMITNQFKAYDYSFVAGDAALARLDRVLWDYDFDKRAIKIGRPQADYFSGELPYRPDERQVVLYAPTWEGDRAAAAYGSVATHGVALVTALLATGAHRVIYRPHPRSGVVDHLYGAANKAIIAAIAAANARDVTAQHVYDSGPDLGWQLAAADVAIVDISAMVYDRLATGKPLIITRPVNPTAVIDTSGYLSDCEWLPAEQAADIVAQVDRLSHDDAAVERLQGWVQRYFGDTAPGVATERLHAAVQHLMDEWDRFAAVHDHDVAILPGPTLIPGDEK